MIQFATEVIISEYKHLCFDDIKLCMQKLVTGQFLEIKEIISLDVERIGKALKLYDDEKTKIYRNNPKNIIFDNEYKENKDAVFFKDLPEDKKEIYNKISINIKKIDADKNEIIISRDSKEIKLKNVVGIKASEIEVMGFDYFDKLRLKQNEKDFINWGGKKYNSIDWQNYFVFFLYHDDDEFENLENYLN